MSLLTPTFSSFPLFTSFSEESRKFEAEADHLWADMQSSMLKTSPNGSKGSSEDLINNNTSKLFQKHNFGENNSWSDIHKAMFERQTLQSPLKDEIHSVTTNSDGSFEVNYVSLNYLNFQLLRYRFFSGKRGVHWLQSRRVVNKSIGQ